MKYKEYQYLIYSDLYRIVGNKKVSYLIKQIFLGESFKYIFWMRTSRYFSKNIFFKYTLYPIARVLLNHYKYKFGIDISYKTNIGSGFYIGHFSGIIVSSQSKIGNNCNISQGVTIGQVNRGKNKGYPILGDNVYIGAGAKIIGNIKIGNNVAIGANCVVTKDIPDNGVVVGIPGKVISYDGSLSYVNRTDY